MPKQKVSQPELIREERADYQITPEEQALKEEYRARLRAFLEDLASRRIEGFPIGENENILALSDPPYYTACPNPFLAEIITQWQAERPASEGKYHREPFATDVSEGKTDPIYNAHSYHTKVPHKAIMRYILHYTEPGDIVFDGFCGTGMTGVAAQLCGDKKAVESLGYRVTDDGRIYEGDRLISRLGARKAVLSDLSPAATFIAYNYNAPVDTRTFEREARRILDEVEQECGWMYETWHPHCDHLQKIKAKINYTVWSEVFACPHCGAELIYYDIAVNKETFEVNDEYDCPGCGAHLFKKNLDRLWVSYFDESQHQAHKLVRYAPVLINYQVGSNRYEKKPDTDDLKLIEKIQSSPISDWYPAYEMLDGERKGKDGYHLKGITHLHHFYFRRALMAYAHVWGKLGLSDAAVESFVRFFVQAACPSFSKMNRYRENAFSQVNQIMSGTLFVGSLTSELSPDYALRNRLTRLSRLQLPGRNGNTAISCQSTTKLASIPDNSFDYVFVDPPFGNNLHYSELNFFWEAWLGVLTERAPEAVMDKGRQRTLHDYQELMVEAFDEIYRMLKPGHWMTVEFHNSQNRVWNAIQEAMQRAGLVVADVRTLDKQQETYKQSIQQLVKQDLVISAYKPNDNLEERFRIEAGTVDGAWDFVRYHFTQLPRVVESKSEIEVIAERQAFLLFDRMVAFHIQRGASVPLSAGEFYAGLKQKFVERDGMYFLPDQIAEYDSARLRLGRVAQFTFLVSDEKTAIQWLRQQLDPELSGEPQTFADLQPQFMRSSNKSKHEQMPELGVILEQNFLEDEAGKWYVPDPNKVTDLERLRLKALLHEFNDYAQSTGRLKQFRTEAIRAGFADAYKRRDYKVILSVAARLPEDVLHEDPDLLMYFDTATLRADESQ